MEDFHIDAELLSSFNEASEEDLQSLAQLYEDPTNDDQIELYIYLCSLMFRRWHNRQNLQKAIQRAEEWAAATAASHPDHSRRCTILTTVLSWGHQSGATAEDLEVVLDATGLNEETPPTRINLNSEVIRLARSYQQTGRLKHLNKAIDIMELAIRITAKYITPTMLNDFGSILVMRFARTGSLNDLNQAVEIFREVVVTTQPHNHPNRVASLNFLGSCLSVRFDQTGSIDDLNQAIEILREAVDAMPQNHPRLAGHLDYLGTQLGRRFEQTIIIADLDEAIRILREAVDATPRKHPDRAARLRNLGGWLNKRYEQMRPINDPNRPVSIVAKGGIHPSGMLRTTNRGRGNMEYLPNVQSGNVDSMESLISRVPMDDVGLRRYDSDGWEVDSDKSNKEANSGERDCKGKSNQLDALGSETESIYWDENTAERAYAPFSTFDYDLQSRRARPSTIPTSSPGTKGSGPHQAHAMPKAEELEIETQKEVESTNAERLHSSYSLTEEETEEQQPFTDDYDIENTYSINTLLNDPRLRYLQVFAEQLIKDMKQVSDKFCFGNIEAGYLDPVLTEFACKLNSESTNAFQREASNMIHRMRKKIIELLVPRPLDHDTTGNQGGESSLSEDEDQDGFLNRTASIKSRTTVMQWIDDVGTAPHAGEELGPSTEDDPVQDNINHEHGSNEPLLQQAHSLEILSRQPHYEQYIRASDAYQWLITTICQHGLLTFQVPNTMLEIRTKIRTQLRAQESPRRMSSRKPLSAVKMTFCFNWDLDRSMRDAGFSPPYEDALGRMVCLTGSWNEAQATTVRDYMDQTWPRSGHALITLIQTLLSTPEGQECSYQAHEPMPSKHRSDVRATRLTACVQSPSICCISVTGGLYFVSEIGEQIGWLASVLQSSSDHHGPVACTPSVNDLRVRVQDEGSHGLTVVGSCNLSFDLETADISELSPGFCWGRLFCNPVLVRGYPILRRTQPNTGLEMSLVDMAAIIGSQQVVQWGERVIIKGFNMLMIATMAAADIIVWHLLVSEQPEERISYVDPRLDTLYGEATKDISLRILEERRHVIGWCSKVTELCGDATANLNLKSSGLRGPPPSIVIDRLYIGVGTGIVRAGVRMGINQQPKPSYLNREKDYPRLLSWVAVQPIVFYDVADHRGWLTDGASALLHLVQVSLYLDKNNPVYNWVFDATKFKDKWDGLTGNQAALKTLASWDNLNLNLYVAREPCRSGGGGNETEYTTLETRVKEILHSIEILVDKQADRNSQGGIRIRQTLDIRSDIIGFDIKDIVGPCSPIDFRINHIDSWGGGWVDIMTSLHTITIFGRGFGDLISPEEPHALCSEWKSVPKGKYYLAASVSTLQMLYDERPEIMSKVVWLSPNHPFKPCECFQRRTGNTKYGDFHTDFVQCLTARKLLRLRLGPRVLAPVDVMALDKKGVVVFGHIHQYFSGRSDGNNVLEQRDDDNLDTASSVKLSSRGTLRSSSANPAASESVKSAGSTSITTPSLEASLNVEVQEEGNSRRDVTERSHKKGKRLRNFIKFWR